MNCRAEAHRTFYASVGAPPFYTRYGRNCYNYLPWRDYIRTFRLLLPAVPRSTLHLIDHFTPFHSSLVFQSSNVHSASLRTPGPVTFGPVRTRVDGQHVAHG